MSFRLSEILENIYGGDSVINTPPLDNVRIFVRGYLLEHICYEYLLEDIDQNIFVINMYWKIFIRRYLWGRVCADNGSSMINTPPLGKATKNGKHTDSSSLFKLIKN